MASYRDFKRKIQRNEGGFQKLRNDRGNYNSLGRLVGTNYGVSAKVFEEIIGRPPSEADMRRITQKQAHTIFKARFWDVIKADQINSQKVADVFADHAINANPKTATKIVQRTLNDYFGYSLRIDGTVGEKTLNAINSTNELMLFRAIAQERIKAYNRYRDCIHFCSVWHGRVKYLAKVHNVDYTVKVPKKKEF